MALSRHDLVELQKNLGQLTGIAAAIIYATVSNGRDTVHKAGSPRTSAALSYL